MNNTLHVSGEISSFGIGSGGFSNSCSSNISCNDILVQYTVWAMTMVVVCSHCTNKNIILKDQSWEVFAIEVIISWTGIKKNDADQSSRLSTGSC